MTTIDPTMRFTALSPLSTQSVVAALRTAPLLSSRSLGPISLQEFGVDASGKLEADKGDAAKVQAAFVESDLPALEALLAAILAGKKHTAALMRPSKPWPAVRARISTASPAFFPGTPAGQATRRATESRRAAPGRGRKQWK